MSQNQFRRSSGGVSRCPDQTSEFVEAVTATVRAQRPVDAEVEAQVLCAVARRSDGLDTPDVLELRATLDVDVDRQAPLGEQVATIIETISRSVAGWTREEDLA